MYSVLVILAVIVAVLLALSYLFRNQKAVVLPLILLRQTRLWVYAKQRMS